MRNKILCAAILMLLAASLFAFAGAEEMSYQGFVYILKEDGTAEITGYDENLPADMWTPFSVPDVHGNHVDITSIAPGAFMNCETITDIFIRDTITEIGDSAFKNCKNLTYAAVLASASNLPDSCFEGCVKLEAFSGSDFTSVGERAFYGCTSLADIILSSGVIIPDCKPTIGASAFENCTSMTFASIDHYWSEIGQRAFAGCTSLKYVYINDIDTIGDYAFAGCPVLQDVEIFCDLSGGFGAHSFESSDNVILFVLSGSTAQLCAQEYGVYSTVVDHIDNTTGLIYRIDFAHEVAVVMGRADGYSGPLTFPKTLGGHTLAGIDPCAFRGNRTLTTVTIPDNIYVIEDGAFAMSSVTEVKLPASLNTQCSYLFYGCTDLVSVTGVKELYTVGYEMFAGCTSLKTVELPETLNSIFGNAFKGCTALETLILPTGNMRIELSAFDDCSNLILSVYDETEAHYFAQQYGVPYKVLNPADDGNDPSATSEMFFSFSIADGKATINRIWYNFWGGVIIPEFVDGCPVTSIDTHFCYGMEIPFAIIPEGVTDIGEYSFSMCCNLKKVVIPASVESIGICVFDGSPNTVLYVHEGSYAHEWAQNKHIAFRLIPAPCTGFAGVPDIVYLPAGVSFSLKLSALPEGSEMPEVTFETNDSSVASVSADGVITTVGAGNAAITVSGGGVTEVMNIAVDDMPVMTLPKAVKLIDEEAFIGNVSVRILDLRESDSVEIAAGAFADIIKLRTVLLPENAVIDDAAFTESDMTVFLCATDAQYNQLTKLGFDCALIK